MTALDAAQIFFRSMARRAWTTNTIVEPNSDSAREALQRVQERADPTGPSGFESAIRLAGEIKDSCDSSIVFDSGIAE
jgi:hypothetical protein